MNDHWRSALKRLYGIDATLTRLDGEYDLNFMVSSADGKKAILKVMRAGCPKELVDMQCRALAAVRENSANCPVPAVIPALSGALFTAALDEIGAERIIWLQHACDGVKYADFGPHSVAILYQLGGEISNLNKALEHFSHPYLERDFKWDLLSGGWIKNKISCINYAKRKDIISEIIVAFERLHPDLSALPCQALHNDLNDHNILVQGSFSHGHTVSGLIDFGDMMRGPRVCEIAIAGAYAVLDHDKPLQALGALVAGYHDASPLSAAEIDMVVPLLRMRLAISVVNSTIEAANNPDDPYITVSQKPAWNFLEMDGIDVAQTTARLRVACGLPVTATASRIHAYLEAERGKFAPLLGVDLNAAPLGDLSVRSSVIPRDPFDLKSAEAANIGSRFAQSPIWLGYYGEPRLIYTADAFNAGPWQASDRRTVHIAVDGFAKAGTPLNAPLSGTVYAVDNRTDNLDYGGVVILRHETPDGDAFYTLYGHLSAEVTKTLGVGQMIAKGQPFCQLADSGENGGWAPHVHFQLALSVDGMGDDWPGVADPDDLDFWTAFCPNPAALLNLPDDKVAYQPIETEAILQKRKRHFGGNLKLSYEKPLTFLRGWRHHLFDEMGRAYLDAYNNVPHVGHAHPRIQAVAADQLLRMNSNTRYLHPAQIDFADRITSKMPAGLDVCFFVNSGSEANELALRLAREHSGGIDMVTPNHGYHGNTTGAIDLSAYKFNKPGGVGKRDWVHLIDVADEFRGQFRRSDPDRATKYADQVDDALKAINKRGGKLAGFIAETFPSVGGQIIPPKGYLAQVYSKIRAAGGVVIADEVQTGLGRLGDHYFGFEHQQVVPDIVVLGKPIGNGHPIGVVVTTSAIAESFANGIEFFSTFGGSTLSCRIGATVLDIVDQERLQQNAKAMGDLLLAGLRALQSRHPLIGDVRGMGLFLGVELIEDTETLAPATSAATYVINRMRDLRVLIGSEGPYDNILKIRPPLTIDQSGVDMILKCFERCLLEMESF